MHNTNSQTKFKITMLRSSLRHYSNAYILAKGTKIILNTVAAGATPNNRNTKVIVILKNCATFHDCLSETIVLLTISSVVV